MGATTLDLNGVVLLIIAALNLLTGMLAFLTHRATKEIKRDVATVQLVTQEIKTDVAIVQKATNGLTDKLVETSKTEAHAAGKEQGRIEGRLEGERKN